MLSRLCIKYSACLRVLGTFAILVICSPVAAITLGQVDDFEDGTTQNWTGASPENVANAGPGGAGDNALFVKADGSAAGSGGKLVVVNRGFQWDGNWTSAGVVQIGMDVRNPNALPLSMRIGIGGPGGVSGGGTVAYGDTHVSTQAITVAADNAWHQIAFPAAASNFTTLTPANGDIAAALASVVHFRILHNPAVDFVGAAVDGDFYVDNIRAIGAPTTLAGDYNDNGKVDAADYVVWRSMLNETVTPGFGADGTGPGGTPDGQVNALDYDLWRSQFGSMLPGAANILGPVAVPEPEPLFLLLALVPAVVWRCR
jgi:hypothetical protein